MYKRQLPPLDRQQFSLNLVAAILVLIVSNQRTSYLLKRSNLAKAGMEGAKTECLLGDKGEITITNGRTNADKTWKRGGERKKQGKSGKNMTKMKGEYRAFHLLLSSAHGVVGARIRSAGCTVCCVLLLLLLLLLPRLLLLGSVVAVVVCCGCGFCACCSC